VIGMNRLPLNLNCSFEILSFNGRDMRDGL
jgi:hypothetical protein